MVDDLTIRAWKDENYRLALNPDARSLVPPSPVGGIELADADIGEVAGGSMPLTQTTICGTSMACVTVIAVTISHNISCGACEQTLWSGTCAVSSIGCCPP